MWFLGLIMLYVPHCEIDLDTQSPSSLFELIDATRHIPCTCMLWYLVLYTYMLLIMNVYFTIQVKAHHIFGIMQVFQIVGKDLFVTSWKYHILNVVEILSLCDNCVIKWQCIPISIMFPDAVMYGISIDMPK